MLTQTIIDYISLPLAALFWPVWLLAAVLLATGVALSIHRAPVKGSTSGISHGSGGQGLLRLRWPDVGRISVVLFGICLVSYIAIIVCWADVSFYWYDSHIFTQFTLRGYDCPIQIHFDNGRFFPLAHQEFNLI